MEEKIIKQVLLEILDLMRTQVHAPKCGYNRCAAARGAQAPVGCEHVEGCRVHYQLDERIQELKTKVQSLASGTDAFDYLCGEGADSSNAP